MKSVLVVAIATIGFALPAVSHADDVAPPEMTADRPVMCLRDNSDLVWRIQCDPQTKVCVYAPNDELDSTGARVKPLERARTCELDAPFDRKKMEADGFTFVAGHVDAPYGWMRDEQQRVFQVNFDLRRRMYLGVAYTPQKILDNPWTSTRTSIDFGLFIFDYMHGNPRAKTRHRIRLFEGQVHMQPFSAEVVMAHYDVSHRFVDPLLRITTFIGPPARHDLVLDLGMWSEAGGLELHRTPAGNSQLWRHATVQATLDLWQSPNLDSFARIRTGFGLEGERDDVNGYRSALAYSTAFDVDWVLDKKGFNYLRFELLHEIPRYFTLPTTADANTSLWTHRYYARMQYETIVLAINDQPLSLKFAAGGERRDDLPGIPDKWAFVFDAGLRFSLWAPPRPRS
jgi:hypothetical protein